MIKAFRYLKPFWLSVLMIVGLVFLQVQFDLALPDYMSDIVTYGIQYGGITDTLPQALSEDTFQKMQYFMDEKDTVRLQENYEITAEGSTLYPDAEGPVYLLKEDTEEVRFCGRVDGPDGRHRK